MNIIKMRYSIEPRAIQKIAEATGDLIGNKIADKITRFQKYLIKSYLIMMMKKKM